MGFFEGSGGTLARNAIVVALWLLVALFVVGIIYGLESLRYLGAGIAATNTISVTGEGQIYATPDIATFTYTVSSTKSTVADAQTAATTASNAVTDYLKSAGVASSDLQTSGYDIEPQYTYQNAVCPQTSVTNGNNSSTVYCPPGKQTLTGYQVSQTTTVKVRDLTKAGDLLAGVGQKGATNLSGLNFTFDDPNAPQDQARQKAIADAQQKAQTLAKQLGVSLVRVTSFSESSGGNPRPLEAYATASGSSASVAPSPEINPGQNQVTDDVTITYEIK